VRGNGAVMAASSPVSIQPKRSSRRTVWHVVPATAADVATSDISTGGISGCAAGPGANKPESTMSGSSAAAETL